MRAPRRYRHRPAVRRPLAGAWSASFVDEQPDGTIRIRHVCKLVVGRSEPEVITLARCA